MKFVRLPSFFQIISLFFVCRSSFSDFAQKFAKDERFKGVEKMRERESLFNEYLIEVRKREKEEKSQRREQVSEKTNLKEREKTMILRAFENLQIIASFDF